MTCLKDSAGVLRGCTFAALLLTNAKVPAADVAEPQAQLRLLQAQNERLEQQLHQQQETIDLLLKKVAAIEQDKTTGVKSAYDADSEAGTRSGVVESLREGKGMNFGKVHLSGEGGMAFFESQADGQYPNAEFRVDEAKLFVEAPVHDNVYFYTEINLATRENTDLDVKLGECYLDFEDVSQLWGRDRMLNIRAGRFDIPFGEEYLVRDAIDNPLITHSLSDFWGVDEGIELYGSLGKVNYVFAVQNGGSPGAQDFNADKALTLRLGTDPTSWLHLGVSAMRTGDINPNNDYWSELWFAGDWFSSISTNSASRLHAELVQGDVSVRLPHGYLKAWGGYAHYNDNDSFVNDNRNIYFYAVEGLHRFTRKFYAAARFSQILVDKGYLLVGNGSMDKYFSQYYNNPPQPLTENLWLLSLGLGYRFSDQLILKAEYAFEQGRQTNGEARDHENLFALQAAFKF